MKMLIPLAGTLQASPYPPAVISSEDAAVLNSSLSFTPGMDEIQLLVCLRVSLRAREVLGL